MWIVVLYTDTLQGPWGIETDRMVERIQKLLNEVTLVLY